MAVFDELIAQPPLSWAFGFGAAAVEDAGADAGPAEPTDGSDSRPDQDVD